MCGADAWTASHAPNCRTRVIMLNTLIVSRNDALKNTLSDYVSAVKLKLYHTNSIEEAQYFLRTIRGEIFVVDRELPDGDGLELLTKGMVPTNRTVVVSLQNKAHDRIGGLKLGVEGLPRQASRPRGTLFTCIPAG